MTRMGVFMRRAVRTTASFHWAALNPRTRPETSAATNTPVPAAESQLMVKRAASGLALAGATGGMRWTMLCSAGMSQTGSESVPANLEPSSVVLKVTPEKRLFIAVLNFGKGVGPLLPQSTQQKMRIAHGSQA